MFLFVPDCTLTRLVVKWCSSSKFVVKMFKILSGVDLIFFCLLLSSTLYPYSKYRVWPTLELRTLLTKPVMVVPAPHWEHEWNAVNKTVQRHKKIPEIVARAPHIIWQSTILINPPWILLLLFIVSVIWGHRCLRVNILGWSYSKYLNAEKYCNIFLF